MTTLMTPLEQIVYELTNELRAHDCGTDKEAHPALFELLEKADAALLASFATPALVIPPMYVYLAGPIMDCDFGEANDWRKYAAGVLRPHNIIGISPLRCEPIHGEKYSAQYADHRFGVPRAIAAKNKFDVRRCEMTLALLPKPAPGRVQSMGTLQEIAWADEAGRMTIQVTDDPLVIVHPVVDSAKGWKMCANPPGSVGGDQPFADFRAALDAGLETCIGVLAGYTGGKNV